MDHRLYEILVQTTEFIEDHLLEELSLDRIADRVNVSKFHLLRIWKGATSTGLMEYVRRRRIALSLGDLLRESSTLEFISYKYSFGCERTYTRVFKEEYGMSPAKWRRNPSPVRILDRFNADFMQRAGEGLMFFRSITVMPAFTIAGREHRVDAEENRKRFTANRLGVEFFYNERLRILNPVNKDVYIGYTAVPVPFEGHTFYQPSVQVDKASIVPPELNVKRIKTHKYGVFTYMGPHRPEDITADSLQTIWQHVSGTWMPTVRFELERPFHFERINYARCSRHYCECDLYYPIAEV
ncbi:AraC family transcriptional regulator [Gorillibacterium sp. sgz500922]|uniref:AraC family transcriptional regulator n=1 Tax=Gorillibacterium sp. sgz500922 TaxID=3446694 RepID=UPI003F67FCEF